MPRDGRGRPLPRFSLSMPGVVHVFRRMSRRHYLHAYAFIAPVVILFGLFRVWPSLQTLYFSVFNVELLKQQLTFVGLSNFRDMLQDPIFRQALVNTLIYAAVIVPVSTVLALLLAVVFTEEFGLKDLFKAVYFSPTVTSTTAAAVVWWWMYNPQFGLFNVILKLLHLPPQPWLMSSHMALSAVIIFSVWKTLGYNMVIYIAGLQAVPVMFQEAATLDGASPFRRFLSITVPLLAPTTIFIMIYNMIFALQVFDQVFVLTSGGPANSTNVVVLELYHQAFRRYRFGYASAEATVLFAIILVVTVFQYVYSRRFEVAY
ncbi:MAG TPA: sugar ABC transporter permease [bacterium]|nr:sugar ABC transporter permease [bacterium]